MRGVLTKSYKCLACNTPLTRHSGADSIGSLNKTYGGTNWLVHAYDDRKSIVIVLDEKNPASPFLFFIFKQDNEYTLYGEGNRDKKVYKASLR